MLVLTFLTPFHALTSLPLLYPSIFQFLEPIMLYFLPSHKLGPSFKPSFHSVAHCATHTVPSLSPAIPKSLLLYLTLSSSLPHCYVILSLLWSLRLSLPWLQPSWAISPSILIFSFSVPHRYVMLYLLQPIILSLPWL